MWRIDKDHHNPVEKSISTVIAHPFRRSDYRSRNEYAWNRTSFRVNLMVVLLFLALVALRVGVVANMDTDKYKGAYEMINVFSALIGSIIAAYIFRLITIHWPESYKKFDQQDKIEGYVASVLLHYHDLYIELLGPHERLIDEKGGYFEKWDPMKPREIHKLMVSKWDGGEHRGIIDPFAQNFYHERERMLEGARKIQEHEEDLGYDLWNRFGLASMALEPRQPWLGNRSDTEYSRLVSLWELAHSVRFYFEYAKYVVFNHKNVSPLMEIVLQRTSYQDVWSDVAIKEGRHHAFDKYKDRVRSSTPVV